MEKSQAGVKIAVIESNLKFGGIGAKLSLKLW